MSVQVVAAAMLLTLSFVDWSDVGCDVGQGHQGTGHQGTKMHTPSKKEKDDLGARLAARYRLVVPKFAGPSGKKKLRPSKGLGLKQKNKSRHAKRDPAALLSQRLLRRWAV